MLKKHLNIFLIFGIMLFISKLSGMEEKETIGSIGLRDDDMVTILLTEKGNTVDMINLFEKETEEVTYCKEGTNIDVVKEQFQVSYKKIKDFEVLHNFIITTHEDSSIVFSQANAYRYEQLKSLLLFKEQPYVTKDIMPTSKNSKLFYLLESAWYFNHEPLKNILIPLFYQKLQTVLFKKSKSNHNKLKKVMRWAHKAEEVPERHLEFFNYAIQDEAFQNFIPLDTRKIECHTKHINAVCFSPDATKLASASHDKQITIADVKTGEILMRLRGHTQPVKSISFSPDGTILASVSQDYLNIWDTKTGECLHTAKYGVDVDSADSVSFSPCGMYIAGIGGRIRGFQFFKIFDLTGKLKRVMRFVIRRTSMDQKMVKYSPIKNQLACGYDTDIYIFSDDSKGPINPTIKDSDVITSMDYSPDGQRLVSGSCGKAIKIWDVESGNCLQVLQEEDVVKAVCFSEDGEQVVFAVGNKVKRWDLQAGKSVLLNQDYSGKINTLSVSQNGTIAFGGEDNCVCLTTATSAWKELSFSQLLLLKYFIQHKQNGSLEKLASSKYCMKKFSKLPKIFRKHLMQ